MTKLQELQRAYEDAWARTEAICGNSRNKRLSALLREARESTQAEITRLVKAGQPVPNTLLMENATRALNRFVGESEFS